MNRRRDLIKKHANGFSEMAVAVRWTLTASVLALTFGIVSYTGHSSRFIAVGVLGIALLAAFFFTAPAARWIIISAVFGLSLLMVFWRLGDGSLYDWDEAVYAEISKEMLQSNVWSTPHLNGVPFLAKPPLNFWLTRLAYEPLGINEFAARLWSAIFGLGVVLLVFFLGWRLRSYAVGAAAALLLLISDHSYFAHWYNFLSLSRVGMLDSALVFWVATALALVWESERRPWLIALIGIPLGLAFMTKAWVGSFALILPAAYTLLRGKGRIDHPRYWAIALSLAAIVVLPWHLWQIWLHGSSFIHEYFTVTVLGRITGLVEQEERGPFFYLGILYRGFSLWALLLPLAYARAAWDAFRHDDRQAQLLLIWITIPLVLLSVARTKLGWYISVIYPAAALLIAFEMAKLLRERLALSAIAVVMAILYIRLPVGANGAPEIKRFSASVKEFQLDSNRAVYVFKDRGNCARPSTSLYEYSPYGIDPASLLFYMDRPLKCIDATDLDRGLNTENAYVIVEQKSLHRFTDFKPILADRYVLTTQSTFVPNRQ